MKIEALHEFHDPDFAQGWSDKFEPTKDRLDLFKTISDQLKDETTFQILELGIGPGYLAEYILTNLSNVRCEGLDYSEAMLSIAKERTSNNNERISFTQADLVNELWSKKIKTQPNAIVSTWALHDLFNLESIKSVFRLAYELLPEGDVFLNGDFVKPEESTTEYEGGRIRPSEHVFLLKDVGFQSVNCIKEFEKNVHNPTTANNYSCFMAVK